MNVDILQLAVPFVAGTVLGLIYFGGLWLTVRDVHRAKHPVGLLFFSFVARVAVVLAAFYLLMDGRWERMVSSLIGFLIVRQVLMHHIRPAADVQKPSARLSP